MLMIVEEPELHMCDARLELSLCQTVYILYVIESEVSECLNKSEVMLLSKKFQQAPELRCSPRYSSVTPHSLRAGGEAGILQK